LARDAVPGRRLLLGCREAGQSACWLWSHADGGRARPRRREPRHGRDGALCFVNIGEAGGGRDSWNALILTLCGGYSAAGPLPAGGRCPYVLVLDDHGRGLPARARKKFIDALFRASRAR